MRALVGSQVRLLAEVLTRTEPPAPPPEEGQARECWQSARRARRSFPILDEASASALRPLWACLPRWGKQRAAERRSARAVKHPPQAGHAVLGVTEEEAFRRSCGNRDCRFQESAKLKRFTRGHCGDSSCSPVHAYEAEVSAPPLPCDARYLVVRRLQSVQKIQEAEGKSRDRSGCGSWFPAAVGGPSRRRVSGERYGWGYRSQSGGNGISREVSLRQRT